jgi:tRNA (mo5U34)-methyltransferase
VFQLSEFRRIQVNTAYGDLRTYTEKQTELAWLLPLLEESRNIITAGKHGDLPHWTTALAGLPQTDHHFDGTHDAPELGKATGNKEALARQLMKFHPWRKGPLRVGGVHIDTEWRSDWKWARVAKHLDLQGHRILDIGCGNGYYGWRMLGQGAECVIGIDPTLVFVMQWLACRHFSGPVPNYVLPLGVEDLPAGADGFDTVFSMGVLYHRRDPVSHLKRLASLLKPGGQLLLETLVLEGDEDRELIPEGRYARMRNVWSVPGLKQLYSWIKDAGLEAARTLDVTRTSPQEQRSTHWMRFESLRECLDPDDATLTIEGYPAPARAVVLINKP